MGRSLIIHKKKDGTVNVEGEFPDQLTISTRYLAKEAAEGNIQMMVAFDLDNGGAVYKMVAAYLGDPENPDSPITGYQFEKVAAKGKGK